MSEKSDRIVEALEEIKSAVVLRDEWIEKIPDILLALSAIETLCRETRDAVRHISDFGCTQRCPPPDGEPTPREAINLDEVRRAAVR